MAQERKRASFRDLVVWQRAKQLAVDVHVTTRQFPRYEFYGLSAQMRNAAISIPANIGGGKGRMSAGDFVRFLRISAGSLAELETYFDISQALGYLNADQCQALQAQADEVGKMLYGLINKIQTGASG